MSIKLLVLIIKLWILKVWPAPIENSYLCSFILVLIFYILFQISKMLILVNACSSVTKTLLTCGTLNMKVKLLVHQRKREFFHFSTKFCHRDESKMPKCGNQCDYHIPGLHLGFLIHLPRCF